MSATCRTDNKHWKWMYIEIVRVDPTLNIIPVYCLGFSLICCLIFVRPLTLNHHTNIDASIRLSKAPRDCISTRVFSNITVLHSFVNSLSKMTVSGFMLPEKLVASTSTMPYPNQNQNLIPKFKIIMNIPC